LDSASSLIVQSESVFLLQLSNKYYPFVTYF